MILYNRKKVKYRKDGYCWKKRKDGKTTREDHMKLKVQGVEVKSRKGSLVPKCHFRATMENGIVGVIRCSHLFEECLLAETLGFAFASLPHPIMTAVWFPVSLGILKPCLSRGSLMYEGGFASCLQNCLLSLCKGLSCMESLQVSGWRGSDLRNFSLEVPQPPPWSWSCPLPVPSKASLPLGDSLPAPSGCFRLEHHRACMILAGLGWSWHLWKHLRLLGTAGFCPRTQPDFLPVSPPAADIQHLRV